MLQSIRLCPNPNIYFDVPVSFIKHEMAGKRTSFALVQAISLSQLISAVTNNCLVFKLRHLVHRNTQKQKQKNQCQKSLVNNSFSWNNMEWIVLQFKCGFMLVSSTPAVSLGLHKAIKPIVRQIVSITIVLCIVTSHLKAVDTIGNYSK